MRTLLLLGIGMPQFGTVIVALAAIGCGGCAAYQVGPGSLYRADIHTVYVPVFQNETLRRNLGERLTEAVVKEIQSRSPYRVTQSDSADSVLTGRIVAETKRVVSETRNDDPRNVEVSMSVHVSWTDHRGGQLMSDAMIPLSPLVLSATRSADFVAEAGQSVSTAQQAAIEKLAQDIVQQMEMPW